MSARVECTSHSAVVECSVKDYSEAVSILLSEICQEVEFMSGLLFAEFVWLTFLDNFFGLNIAELIKC